MSEDLNVRQSDKALGAELAALAMEVAIGDPSDELIDRYAALKRYFWRIAEEGEL